MRVLFEQVKNNDEAVVLCMTTKGNIKLRQKDMEGTKVYSMLCVLTFFSSELLQTPEFYCSSDNASA